MSYIHEALKKAQKEKEAHYHEYRGIVSAPGHKPRSYSGKVLWLTSLLLISLAFAGYLLLPSRGTQAPIHQAEVPEASAQQKSIATAAAVYQKARVYHKRGRLQEAMRLYEKTLSIDPKNVDALNNLGVIHIHDRRYPAARASFAKAIRLRPNYVDAYYNLACLYALEGRVSQSLVHLKKAISLDPMVKDWARRDTDLRNLRGVPEFEEIIRHGGE